MRKLRIVLTMLTVVLLASAFAYADSIIYDNGGPNQQNGNEMTEWIQTEDFTLTQAVNVTDIHFWDIESAPGYAGSITWWIVGDNGGNPDFNNVFGTGSADPTRVNTQCGILGAYCEYSNDWNINPLTLAAGTYHLALHNGPVTDENYSFFYWETTNPNGTQTGLECQLGVACYDSWNNNGNEHAFYLTGTSVPEPGTLMLMGTGLLGGLASLRRRFL